VSLTRAFPSVDVPFSTILLQYSRFPCFRSLSWCEPFVQSRPAHNFSSLQIRAFRQLFNDTPFRVAFDLGAKACFRPFLFCFAALLRELFPPSFFFLPKPAFIKGNPVQTALKLGFAHLRRSNMTDNPSIPAVNPRSPPNAYWAAGFLPICVESERSPSLHRGGQLSRRTDSLLSISFNELRQILLLPGSS